MNRKLLQSIHELCELRDDFEKIGSAVDENFKNHLQTELMNFLSYLSASDGIIDPMEAAFLREYLGDFFSPEELAHYIDTENIYSTEFETTVPAMLIRFLERDNRRYERSHKLVSSFAKAYIEVFASAGKEFLICDGEATDEEVADYSVYLKTLNDYFTANAVFPPDIKSAVDTSEIHPGERIPTFNEDGERELTLDDYLDELYSLVGLENVKREVSSLIHLQEIRLLRKDRGLKDIPISHHLVFSGNPGTGKTTVARLIAKIYHSIGILSIGHLVEVDRADLIAEFVGQTGPKVKKVVKRALGGILFIDEAYALTQSESKNDYGAEAIAVLLREMEEHRDDLIVIVAGYPDLMKEFITSNPGLESRFKKYIYFSDYDARELLSIFDLLCKKNEYIPTDEVRKYVGNRFGSSLNSLAYEGVNGNGRDVRNFFEEAVVKQANRLYQMENPSNLELCTLELSDVIGI